MRRLIIIVIGLLLISTILIASVITTESGLHWVYRQAPTYLLAGLTIDKLEGKLIGPIRFSGVEYQQHGVTIKAEQILLDWHPVSLLTTKIDISQLQVRSLEINLREAEKTSPGPTALANVYLPWRTVVSKLEIDGITVRQPEKTIKLQKISLNASTFLSNLNIQKLTVIADDFSIDLHGDLHAAGNWQHELGIEWQAKLPSNAVIKGTGKLSGNRETTNISQVLSGPLQMTLDAQIYQPLERFNWRAKIDASTSNLAQLIAGSPELAGKLALQAQGDLKTASASGTVNSAYPDIGPFDASFALQTLENQRVKIERLVILTPLSNTRIGAQGYWSPGNQGGNIELALDWQNLRWPLKGDAWFDATNGSGNIEGNLEHFGLDLTTDSHLAQVGPSSWSATAEGNLDGLKFKSLRVRAVNAEVSGSGQLSWSPKLLWNAELSATNLDPAALLPDWPGQINTTLSSRGRVEKDGLTVDTEITSFTGKLRDYPVSLLGRVTWSELGFEIHQMDFNSGTSKVSASGRVGDTVKLDWRITSNSLAELYPQAQGEFKASGQLSGPRNTPRIEGILNAKGLSLPGYEVGSVDARVALDLFKWQQFDVWLAAQAIKLPGYTLQTADITADAQKLLANFSSDDISAQIELKGGWVADVWRGQVERADIQTRNFDNWQLENPAAISVSENTLQAETLCWQNSQQSSLCSALQRQQETWQTQLKLQRLPLQLLSTWLPSDLQLEGSVDGTARLRYQYPEQLFGNLQFALAPGLISYPVLKQEQDSWQYRGGKVDILLDEQGVSGRSDIAINSVDQLSIKLNLPGAQLFSLNPQQQTLSGEARLSVHDLGLIEAFLPEVQDLKGEIILNVAARGTLAQPRLSGLAELSKAALQIPRLGLVLDRLNVQAQSDGFKTVKLKLDAHSGDGLIAIEGQTILDKAAGWPTQISIKGDNFEASRIPEARVLVSPDLQAKLQHHTITISGNVNIPYAKLQPKDFTTTARVSNDVVILGEDQVGEEKWDVDTRIRLTLGERVSFFGFGFDGRLDGNLLLQDEPGQPTKATGEINIPEGRYRAYGQHLDVEYGRLLYTGGPLTNPGLNLRAVRKTNDVTAGIRVKGSLNQPLLELFSTPAMGQTDTLSYLMLGRPMETASGEEGAVVAKAALALGLSGGDRLARLLGDRFGLDEMRVESGSNDQASLVVGRYLSPRLYISYGVGLIEAINTFSLRYKISDKWQLKAESGEAQGADFLYTIDR